MQTEVILGIGGNKGDRSSYLARAREALSREVMLISSSQVYETEAWGGVAENGSFLNQVLLVHTSLEPLALLKLTQAIELSLGRTRDQHWGDRTIDIDILYFGDQVCSSSSLTIPHPYLTQRSFVLQPLAEILPKKIHPILRKTTLELLAECTDQGQISVWKQAK